MSKFKSHKTVEQIAKKHRIEVSFVKKQLEMGIPIEHEHTKDKDLATYIALQHLDEIPDYYTRLKKMESSAKKNVDEGTLHHWFQGSSGKTKSGRTVKGWVQADGSPCANEPGETKTPKCFSSARLRSLKSKGKKGDSLIRSAVRRKREKDKGQQEKSGAASPTYVSTFAKGKKDPNYVKAEPGIKEAMDLNEAKKDKPGKGSGKKDACYHKVKAKYDVWPSAYASGALVQCRKKGADNWGESVEMIRYCPKCKKDEKQSECKYGPKFWAMYSTPAKLGDTVGLTDNQLKYNPTRPHPGNFPESYDHEHSMARSELSTIISAARRLRKKMKGEGNIEAWVQSKITKAADYLDSAADYIDSGEMNSESVSIEDANGNHYAEFIDIIKPEPLKPSQGIGNRFIDEASFDINPSAHRQAQRKEKVRQVLNRAGTEGEASAADAALKRMGGPGAQLMKFADSTNLKTFGEFMQEAIDKSKMKCNSPKSDPVGDSLTGKSHVVKACENGKEKIIRFGQKGVKGSPKKKGESKEYASRRERFKARHAKNISKGKMSAAYWANKVKW